MKPPGGRAKQAGRRATGEAELVVADGDNIVREGDVGHDMFIVQSGRGGLLFRLRRDPTFALEMLNHLSSRLRAAQARLIALGPDEQEPGA